MNSTILCIDDIPANLFTLQSVLESDIEKSYKIYTATSAESGFDILSKESVDLILLDVMMPDIDGFATAKMLKSNRKTKKIPIIFVTAKNDDATIQKCYEVGGADYANKPFNNFELLTRVTFQLELAQKDAILKEQQEFSQNILDLQENIILVSDGIVPIHANRAFFNLLGIKNIKKLIKENICICDMFIKEDGFFSKDAESNINWIESVYKLDKEGDVLVKIIKKDKLSIFTLKVSLLNELYILTFTDITSISEQSQQFEKDASYDKLTQIYNRHKFHDIMNKKMLKAKQVKFDFVLIILDIDFFKAVNDTHGHLVGDNILISMANLIKSNIRSSDLFARWGGEEFILVYDVGIDKGVELAEHIRASIEKAEFEVVDNISCSFGISEYRESDDLEMIIKRADDALYEAKHTGRNRVCKL